MYNHYSVPRIELCKILHAFYNANTQLHNKNWNLFDNIPKLNSISLRRFDFTLNDI